MDLLRHGPVELGAGTADVGPCLYSTYRHPFVHTSPVGMAMAGLSCGTSWGLAQQKCCDAQTQSASHSVMSIFICRQDHSMAQLWQGQAGA